MLRAGQMKGAWLWGIRGKLKSPWKTLARSFEILNYKLWKWNLCFAGTNNTGTEESSVIKETSITEVKSSGKHLDRVNLDAEVQRWPRLFLYLQPDLESWRGCWEKLRHNTSGRVRVPEESPAEVVGEGAALFHWIPKRFGEASIIGWLPRTAAAAEVKSKSGASWPDPWSLEGCEWGLRSHWTLGLLWFDCDWALILPS